MKNKKIFFRICLLVLTAISCSAVSTIFFGPDSSQTIEPTLYSLDDALTLANQTIQAETRNNATQHTSLNTLAYTPTPEPANADINSQVQILGEHRVASMETFSCIGRAYGVSPKAIADVNGMDLLAKLEVGQILKIPAVQWTNITNGPVCPRQFAPPDWNVETPGSSRQSSEDDDAIEPIATEPPDSGASEPIATDSPDGGDDEPPLSLPRCPPRCIWPIDPPIDPPQPGPTEVPIAP